ncbi:hypothetical protein BU23DRAFT_140737 [Bimuria novae-zelandiae CBS 107.79]|uniref:Uncharacterized protein n=1 Tax=Bimuria novae-zelandiae CBS 107.79 TaxID=1447943 RepID=A0A6A5V9L3_9PLEO|nr:hypothetical protein BU23DRAFT_140737 [Bimuria novae-zelandiae CBS 107.79]
MHASAGLPECLAKCPIANEPLQRCHGNTDACVAMVAPVGGNSFPRDILTLVLHRRLCGEEDGAWVISALVVAGDGCQLCQGSSWMHSQAIWHLSRLQHTCFKVTCRGADFRLVNGDHFKNCLGARKCSTRKADREGVQACTTL